MLQWALIDEADVMRLANCLTKGSSGRPKGPWRGSLRSIHGTFKAWSKMHSSRVFALTRSWQAVELLIEKD